MESNNTTQAYPVEHIVKDGKKMVIMSHEDYQELMEVVEHYQELLDVVEGMMHLDDCDEEECGGCSDQD